MPPNRPRQTSPRWLIRTPSHRAFSSVAIDSGGFFVAFAAIFQGGAIRLTFHDTVLIYWVLREQITWFLILSVWILFAPNRAYQILGNPERRRHNDQLFKRIKMLFSGKKEIDGRAWKMQFLFWWLWIVPWLLSQSSPGKRPTIPCLYNQLIF